VAEWLKARDCKSRLITSTEVQILPCPPNYGGTRAVLGYCIWARVKPSGGERPPASPKENKMIFFTADEHYGHANIIKFCNRPFDSVHEMNKGIIERHNELVTPEDTVLHAGDFTLQSNADKYIDRLNGRHVFLLGSHDKWLFSNAPAILEKKIQGQWVIACHYAMRVWARSHYNSWQVYGHSHGGLPPVGKQWDVGVDNNDFYPISFDQLCKIMEKQPDNFNLVRKRNR
jgi:calcineurin-like phosphoesterase family protein